MTKAPGRVSDIRRVSWERTRTVETNLFYTLSVKILNINNNDNVMYAGKGWVVVYCSEGIQTSGEAVDWQPLPTDRVFPLGLSYIRRGRDFKIDVFECEDSVSSGCVYPTESDVDSRHGRLVAGWTVALDCDTPRHHCTAIDGQSIHDSSSPPNSWLRCHVDFEGEYSMLLLADTTPSSQHTDVVDTDDDGNDRDRKDRLLNECLDDIERRYYGDVWTRRRAHQEPTCSSSNTSVVSKKHLMLMQHVYAATRQIAALQHQWQESYAECNKKRAACVVSSDSRLKQLHHACVTAKARYEMLKNQLEREKESIALRSQKQKVKSQALMNTLQALVQASSKVCSSKVALQGMDGQGRVDGISKQLHSRQTMMLAELARVYNLVERKIQVNTSTARRANDAGIAPSTSIGTQMDLNWTGGAHAAESSHHGETASHHMHYEYTIQGLHVDSLVWKHAFSSRDADDYPSSDPATDKNTSIALGYVAHVVLKASHYLGIPLRYPIIFRGSYSIIMDNYDSAASNAPAGTSCSEFPLHCYATKDRPRFAIAVFLLYKDILQLLQTHYDTDPPLVGPNHIMSSLYTLLCCIDYTI